MLVKYKIPGAVGGWTLLFDESNGDANEEFAPSFRDSVFKPAGYGAASVAKVPMANTDGQLAFRWAQNYASAAAAATGIATLRATFKGISVHLQVTVGATKLYFPNAVMNSSSHKQKNIEVIHSVSFETDDVTTTEPA